MGGSSSPQNFSFEAGTLASIELPARTVERLQAEAKRARKPIAKFVLEWLDDQAEEREAAKVIKRIKEGKEKMIPAAEVYAKLGL